MYFSNLSKPEKSAANFALMQKVGESRVFVTRQPSIDLQIAFTRAAGSSAPAAPFIAQQNARQLRQSLKRYYSQRNYKWSMREWDAQPWFKKIFIRKPEKPASIH